MADGIKITDYPAIGNEGDPSEILFGPDAKEAGQAGYASVSMPFTRFSDAWRPAGCFPTYEDYGGGTRLAKIVQNHEKLTADGETYADGGEDAQAETRFAYSNPSFPDQATASETRLAVFDSRPITNRIERTVFSWGSGQITGTTVTRIPSFTIL